MTTRTPVETMLARRFEPHEEIPIPHIYLGVMIVWEVVGYTEYEGVQVELVRKLRTEPMPNNGRRGR